ncbi:MAG: hypothetical protein JWP42_1681 [Pseudomonas sp.]|nr:hypothetical protein [Pseudomonas sp.]
MTMSKPEHIIDFANPDLPVVELETSILRWSTPRIAAAAGGILSTRRTGPPQESGKPPSIWNAVSVTTTSSAICSKDRCA